MARSRRILLAAQPQDGGVAEHVAGLARALPARGFSVDVACPRGSTTWSSLAGTAAVSLHAIQPQRRPAPGDARSLATLLRLVTEADVVHVHSAKAGFLGRLAAALRGRRETCAFTPHAWSFWAVEGAEARLYQRLERLAARWCEAIVALSSDERDAGLGERIGRPEQYRVIPNGVSLERFGLARAPERGRVVLVGRLARQKRPDVALRAFARAREQVPEATLDLVGDGPLRGESERLAAELGLEGAVRFLGSRDDVPELLAAAECLLLASDYEGSPLVVAEAMAAGVAVVATDAAGTKDLIRPGQTGLIGPRGDAEALGAQLAEILGTPGRAGKLGAEGRRAAVAELSQERMVDRIVAVYDELLMPRTRE